MVRFSQLSNLFPFWRSLENFTLKDRLRDLVIRLIIIILVKREIYNSKLTVFAMGITFFAKTLPKTASTPIDFSP